VLVDSAQLKGPVQRVKTVKAPKVQEWKSPGFQWDIPNLNVTLPTHTTGMAAGIPYTTNTTSTANYYTASAVTGK
jgi:hypothetical protein